MATHINCPPIVFHGTMKVIFAPGQGSQKTGMLTAWLNNPEAKKLLTQWSNLIDLDLIYLGTQASVEEITDTAIAQPLIVAAGILSFRSLSSVIKFPETTIIAGHSIGEITTAAIASIITDEQAILLAAQRGRLMSTACREAPSSMAAVLGGQREIVLNLITELNLTPANFNAEGQIVVAGAHDKIDKLIANPPNGSRVRKLTVAGAFHSPFMASAQKKFATIVQEIEPSDPIYVTLSNRDGHPISSGKKFLDRIVEQITSPVYWTSCLEYIRSTKTEGPLLELTPAGVLLGIAKRELKEIPGIAINTPQDVEIQISGLQTV